MELVKLKQYMPEQMIYGDDVQYFIDENGNDWYASLGKFKKPYTIAYDSETDIVHSYSADASAIYPAGLNVVDVDSIPDGFDIADSWFYKNGVILKDYAGQAINDRIRLLETANTITNDWRIELQLGIISDEDKETLTNWMMYIKSLKSLDLTEIKNREEYQSIKWPTQP